MTVQTWIVLALVLTAAAYIVRNLVRSATAKGCSTGCGGCASRTCSLRKLDSLHEHSR